VIQIKKYIPVMIMFCMMLMLAPASLYAQETSFTNKVLQPVSLGTVKLKDNVSVQITNLIALPSGTNQMVGLTVKMINNSNSEINFMDYWVNVYTKSGTKITLQLVDSSVNKIPAKTTIDINFIGTLGNNIKVTDLVIKVIKWDFSVSSYEKVLGQITVPQRYTVVTPAGSGRSVVTGDVSASFVISKAVIGKSESYYRPDITIAIRNDGNRTITLPDYQLYILTSNNLMYPLTAKNLKGTSLDPLIEKEFQLTANIPIKVDPSNWKLAVVNNLNEGKDKQPVAIFELPKAQVSTGDELGKYYTFSNSNGIYNIRLDSLNRLPIEDDDLIIANLTLANKGNKALVVPSLIGTYTFNESIEKSATGMNNAKLISLQPGATASLQLVTKVPYTFDISKLYLTVQQKDSNDSSGETTDLVEFSYSGQFKGVDRVTASTGFAITDVGYRSDVKLKNLKLYDGENADIIASELVVTNNEKRQAAIQAFAGYFEKSDGTIYPATFSSVTDKINPGGKALIYVTASVPKEIDMNDVSLVVGKAITETTGTDQTTKETVIGYTSPYSFILPAITQAQAGMQNIDLTPFQFSVTKIGTEMRYQEKQMILHLDYKLTQDLLTKASTKDHKIVVEILDSTRNQKFVKELSLPGSTSNSEDAALAIGNNSLKITWTSDELALLHTLKDYQFNVYYQIESGYRTLVATEEIPWLVTRTLSSE
jgi:hypothetical protein